MCFNTTCNADSPWTSLANVTPQHCNDILLATLQPPAEALDGLQLPELSHLSTACTTLGHYSRAAQAQHGLLFAGAALEAFRFTPPVLLAP